MVRASRDKERGQTLIIVALAMVVLVGSLALAIDGGNAYAQRRRMQNAADAAALAGAKALALGENPEPVAAEYAVNRNGADSVEVTVDGQAVTVVARKSFPSFFASVVGWPTLEAAAYATASYAPVGAMTGGVFPIAAYLEDFEYGESYDIFAGGGPGNFGWLGWAGCAEEPILCESPTDPANSENYVNPDDPDDHVLSIGDWVEGSTGVIDAQCVRDQLDALHETPITVVVWDEATQQGANLDYRIAGFAVFVLEDHGLPAENRISGRFVEWVTCPTGFTSGSGYGAYGVTLTQ